jgi:hypothetical protein
MIMRKPIVAFLSTLSVTGILFTSWSVHAQAPTAGIVTVSNQSELPIHPWFKCPAPACNADGSWTFYGGIGPGGSFSWDFSSVPGDFAFTYTVGGDPAPTDPVQGDRKALFSVDVTTNTVVQIGNKIRAIDLNAPGENGKSAR